MKITYEGHEYCMKCGKEYFEPIEKPCICGNDSFIKGDVIRRGNFWVCKCGNEENKLTSHIDFTKYSLNQYTCNTCKAKIVTMYLRKNDDFMYS